MNKNRIQNFEFILTASEIFAKRTIFSDPCGLMNFYGNIKQTIPKIGHKLSHIYLAPFSTTITFFEDYPKIKSNRSCISMNSCSWICTVISNSSSFSLSGPPYFSQMSSILLVTLTWQFSFKPFSPSSSNPIIRNQQLFFSCHWYLILIPIVIILVSELITSQQDYFNNFLADLSWFCLWPLQYCSYTMAFFTWFIFPTQNASRFLHNQQNKNSLVYHLRPFSSDSNLLI